VVKKEQCIRYIRFHIRFHKVKNSFKCVIDKNDNNIFFNKKVIVGFINILEHVISSSTNTG
jgi:hypothetical protein